MWIGSLSSSGVSLPFSRWSYHGLRGILSEFHRSVLCPFMRVLTYSLKALYSRRDLSLPVSWWFFRRWFLCLIVPLMYSGSRYGLLFGGLFCCLGNCSLDVWRVEISVWLHFVFLKHLWSSPSVNLVPILGQY